MNFRDSISKYRSQLMGLAMIFILLFHQLFVGNKIMGYTTGSFGMYGVDIFLFLSGFGCYYSIKKHSVLCFYIRRFIRIMPACLIIGTTKVLFTNYAPEFVASTPNNTFTQLSYSWLTFFSLDMWYIRTILILYILCPIIVNLYAKIQIKYVILAVAILSIILIYAKIDKFIIRWTAPRLLVFVIGIAIAKNVFNLTPKRVIMSSIALIIAITIKVISRFYDLSYYADINFMAFALAMPIVIYVLIYCCQFIKKFNILDIIINKYIGLVTLEIYICHEYIYKCVYNIFSNYHYDLSLGLFPAIIISIAFAWFVHLITKRITFDIRST